MDEINLNIQSARIGHQGTGKYQLTLVMLNKPDVDVLRRIVGAKPALKYLYDGSDITFYLLLILNQTGKKIRIPVNASAGTLKWLELIDRQLVDTVSFAHFDGKGGLIKQSEPIKIANAPGA